VRVNRNHFGRQVESFQATLDVPFLQELDGDKRKSPFLGVFIRAPIVERLLPNVLGIQEGEAKKGGTVVAPSRAIGPGVDPILKGAPVEILVTLPGRAATLKDDRTKENLDAEAGDIVAVRQANVFGTSFHPELTGDPRIHVWWLKQVVEALGANGT
jgi:pyridoxal 5'-phosphate synthase pdxT subunit